MCPLAPLISYEILDITTYEIFLVPEEEFMIVRTNQRSSRNPVETPPCKLACETSKLALLGEETR